MLYWYGQYSNLCTGHYDDPLLSSLSQSLYDVLSVTGHVPCSIALQHHTLDRGREEVLDGLCPDGGEEPEEHHIPAQVGVNIQGRDGASFPDSFVVDMDVNTNRGKGGEVGTFKCMEGPRANLVQGEVLQKIIIKIIPTLIVLFPLISLWLK